MSESVTGSSSGSAVPSASSARARAMATASRFPPPTVPQIRSVATTIFVPASRGACPRTDARVTSTPGSRAARSASTALNQCTSVSSRLGEHVLHALGVRT